MKKFVKDFKEFIAKGNVMDMAVAVIIGAAFGKIVTSLVNDIIMPLISMLFGGKSISDWKYVITPEVKDEAGTVITEESAIRWGLFIQTIIDFLLVALVIFLVLKAFMKMKKNFQTIHSLKFLQIIIIHIENLMQIMKILFHQQLKAFQ